MAIDFSIGAIDGFKYLTEASEAAKPKGVSPFSSFFDAAMDLVKETNQLQVVSENWQTDLATGKTDDILSVLLAQDRAYNALNFTVQVTNKIIEAYREIMRMQI